MTVRRKAPRFERYALCSMRYAWLEIGMIIAEGKAIKLQHFTDEQVMAKCDVILEVLSDVFKGERV